MFTSLVFLSAVFGGAAQACTGTIKSLADVPAAVKCTVIDINRFTVPPATAFKLNLLPGTIVNLNGDISFGAKGWVGPMFSISGTHITFNGNGHNFDGAGPFYWDGKGLKGKVRKPLMMQFVSFHLYADILAEVRFSPGLATFWLNSNPDLKVQLGHPSNLNLDP